MIGLLNAVNKSLQYVDVDALIASLDRGETNGNGDGKLPPDIKLEVDSEEIWTKLRSMWDLDRLDELVS